MDFFNGSVNSLLFVLCLGIWPFLARFLIKYLWRPWMIYRALKKQGFKGPSPRFMIGNLLDIANTVQQQLLTDMPSIHHDFRNRVFPFMVKWSQTYGEKFFLWFGYEPRIILTDAELIRELLSSKNLTDSGRSPMLQKMLSVAFGKGLFSVNGQKWSRQRRIVAPAFHAEKLKAYVDIMSISTAQMVDVWNKIIGEVTERPCELELSDYMGELTADIFMRIGFGIDYKLGREIYEDISMLEELMIHNVRYLWLPGTRYIPTSTNVELWKRARRLERNLKHMIHQRRESGSYGHDLLGLMLSEIDSEKDFIYTTQQVMDECKTFFLAGRETTSLLLSWAILLLALNQDWQQKAREESMAVCGNSHPTMDSLGKLKTIGMILNETLRLYPPAAGIVRQAFKDIKLGNDLIVPKDVNVVIDLLSVHRDPRYWGDDGYEFRPERFREGISKATNNHPSAFIPFSSGPRVCIGQNFAMLEAKVVMAMMLRTFKFGVSSSYRHAPVAFLTIKPQHGIPILVERC